VDDLPQEIILDHGRRPRNHRSLPDASRRAEADNPLCGDRVRVCLRVEGGQVRDITFEEDGCCLSLASASLMSELLAGQTVEQARRLHDRFCGMLVDGRTAGELGPLAAFAGARQYPMRVKCATLAWHTRMAALRSFGGA
jgi:nitrogen fixation NifU-like protein